MNIQQQLAHTKRNVEDNLWFERTVELPTVPQLLDQVEDLRANNEQLAAHNRKINAIAAAIVIMFFLVVLWKCQTA